MAAGFAPQKKRKRRKKNTLGYAIGGGLFVIMAAVVVFLLLRESPDSSVAARENDQNAQVTSEADARDSGRQAGRTEDDDWIADIAVPRPAGFTGRYRLGPEKAAIRVVAITDYQCPACRNVEASLQDLARRYDGLSLSIKHFPACPDCNDRFLDMEMHPNACRAARAAEAAGLLWGDEGFWELHNWLFEHHGEFTLGELREQVRAMGRDTSKFMRLMEDDKTLALIKEDIEEAVALGLQYTPMVFINGVELKGTQARNAVVRAIDALAAENLPALTAEADTPPTAPERYLAAWRDQPERLLPPDEGAIKFGEDGARLKVVMWGDYEDAHTARVDRLIRRLIEGRTDTQYVFRHFPVNTGCNELIRETQHPFACLAARAVEAVQMMRGEEAARRLHIWLIEHSDVLNDVAMKSSVAGMGIDVDQFTEKMKGGDVAAAIDVEVKAALEVGLSNTPWLYVNNRKVPRFMGEGDAILGLIFSEAIGE